MNWHYHPLSYDRNPLRCAVNYFNSYDVLLQVLTRRVIDENWFPSVNRPGFHSERQDIHMFLEQWIPFDYANQVYDFDDGQKDLVAGRFGDWRRAPKTWRGYHPHHDDYQSEGLCRRRIFRCLNVGTRFNLLKGNHVREAFKEAQEKGSAVLSFSNHDYREMRDDIDYVRGLLSEHRSDFPDVKIAFSGANEAARKVVAQKNFKQVPVVLSSRIVANRFEVSVETGFLFGPQPFLAIKTKDGRYFHDNFDENIKGKSYSYTFDFHTLDLETVSVIAAATCDNLGNINITRCELS